MRIEQIVSVYVSLQEDVFNSSVDLLFSHMFIIRYTDQNTYNLILSRSQTHNTKACFRK